ncbi:MAG: GNAT family N-acetyltransferase [Capsulimonadaceae bacterium]|nr:GNAT family N-acetyltransferase [Capsulimonadaceae bacterium]
MSKVHYDSSLTDIRPLTPDDKPDHDKLMAEAFSRGKRARVDQPVDETQPRKFDRTSHYGAFEGPRLVAAVTVHDIALHWGARLAPMGGVAGVACTADRRGSGYVGRLLRRALAEMREAGQYLSGLYPFAFAFYRSYGWEWVGEKRITTLPLSLLPARDEARYVTMFEGLDAREDAADAYAAVAKRYRGMVARDETPYPDFWKGALDHRDGRTTYVQVFRAPESGAPEGYFTFSYPQSGDVAAVTEFLAATPRAFRGLLGVLHNYGTQMKTVELIRPIDDPLTLDVMHWDIDVKIRPLFMGRLVDVAAAFAALDLPEELQGSVAIAVRDKNCDWNNAAFKIAVDQGQVAVSRSVLAPDVTLDIQSLTQAYWGWPSLSALRDADRIAVDSEAGYRLLEAILPPARPFITDFF